MQKKGGGEGGGLLMADCSLQVKNDLLMFIFLHFYIQIQCPPGGPLRMMGKCLLH